MFPDGHSEFKDQLGQIDIERTVEAHQDVLITETLSSFHPVDHKAETKGTNWMYVFTDRDHVEAQNLTRHFVLHLTQCPS
jgi:hypothetical protein